MFDQWIGPTDSSGRIISEHVSMFDRFNVLENFRRTQSSAERQLESEISDPSLRGCDLKTSWLGETRRWNCEVKHELTERLETVLSGRAAVSSPDAHLVSYIWIRVVIS